MYEKLKCVLFGYCTKPTADKLRKFFKKHTGKDIDFYSYLNERTRFRLMLFSIPLQSVCPISVIESQSMHLPVYKQIHESVEYFIDWYENDYLRR